MTVGEAVVLDARDSRESCDRGESRPVGKGNSFGSCSLALALPFLDSDLSSSKSSSASSTDDSEVDVDVLDANVDDEPNESEPDELDEQCKPGLGGA